MRSILLIIELNIVKAIKIEIYQLKNKKIESLKVFSNDIY
jgi:hypothetical protein